MSRLGRDESGAASFIVVVFLAIILSILTLGFVRLAVNERRSATDDDLTKRAYYAAESGTEDALRAIQEVRAGTMTLEELNGEDCGPPDGYTPNVNGNSGVETEYTCQLIDMTPEKYTGKLNGANEAVSLPLTPVSDAGARLDLKSITIRWHVDSTVADGGDGLISAAALPTATDSTLKTVDAWSTSPNIAMLRANIFMHDYDSLEEADLGEEDNQYATFLYPNGAGDGDGGSVDDNPGGTLSHATCNDVGNGAFACEATIDGFDSDKQYYLNLASLYRGTQFEVEMQAMTFLIPGVPAVPPAFPGDPGTPAIPPVPPQSATSYFSEAQAVIDVTGRAGDVYRRVRTTVDFDNSAFLPTQALTSLDAICKNFRVTDDTAEFSAASGTSCEP